MAEQSSATIISKNSTKPPQAASLLQSKSAFLKNRIIKTSTDENGFNVNAYQKGNIFISIDVKFRIQ